VVADLSEESHHTPKPVAAHLRLGAIGVEQVHARVRAFVTGQNGEHPVGSDPAVNVTDLSRPVRRHQRTVGSSVDDDEVIP